MSNYMPKASLCFLVHARLILSIIIASRQIPIPAAKARPVSDLANPLKTSNPRPFPPISGVTICIAKAIITV